MDKYGSIKITGRNTVICTLKIWFNSNEKTAKTTLSGLFVLLVALPIMQLPYPHNSVYCVVNIK